MDETVVKFNSKIIHQELRLGIHNIMCSVYRSLISQMGNLSCFMLYNISVLKCEVLFELQLSY